MDKTNEKYGAYLQILKEELVPGGFERYVVIEV